MTTHHEILNSFLWFTSPVIHVISATLPYEATIYYNLLKWIPSHAYPITFQQAQNKIYIFMHRVCLKSMTLWKLLVNLVFNFIVSQVKWIKKNVWKLWSYKFYPSLNVGQQESRTTWSVSVSFITRLDIYTFPLKIKVGRFVSLYYIC